MPVVAGSRYQYSDVHTDELGRLFGDVPAPATKRKFPDDVGVTIGEGDTLHKLAWSRFLSKLDPSKDIRPTTWWYLIGEINGVIDPLQPLPTGEVFRLPSVEVLDGVSEGDQVITSGHFTMAHDTPVTITGSS